MSYVFTFSYCSWGFQGKNTEVFCYSLLQWTTFCENPDQTRLGANCGSDHELLIAKFRLKSKKVGKTTRPFRYDLNRTPYDYTVEVRNRFKGLDLIECLMNYGWRFMTLYRRQGSRPSPWKKNAKNKMAVLGGLTNSCEKKRSKRQRRKGKIYPFEHRVPNNSKER